MLELLNDVTELLRGTLGSPWVWLLIFGVAALDALLPFMPSETTVITVAVLVSPHLPKLLLLFAVAAIGAWAGDCTSYWVGRRAGPAMLNRLLTGRDTGERRNSRVARYEWAQEQVDRHNAPLIIAARYLPGGRVASGLASGGMGVRWFRFAVLDLLGAALWAFYSVFVGCLGGAGFDEPGKALLLSFAIGLTMVGAIALSRRLKSWRASRRRVSRTVPVGDPEPVRRPALRSDHRRP